MLIGETPGEIEDKIGIPFQGEKGALLKKMLSAINININKIYSTYSINFRPPADRKPTGQEIKRFSPFLKKSAPFLWRLAILAISVNIYVFNF